MQNLSGNDCFAGKVEGVKLHFFHFDSFIVKIRWASLYLTLSREMKRKLKNENQSGNLRSGNLGREIGINKLLKIVFQ